MFTLGCGIGKLVFRQSIPHNSFNNKQKCILLELTQGNKVSYPTIKNILLTLRFEKEES